MIHFDTSQMIEALEEVRLTNEWTQIEMANKLGVSRATYMRWSNQKKSPSKIHAFRIKKFLAGRPKGV